MFLYYFDILILKIKKIFFSFKLIIFFKGITSFNHKPHFQEVKKHAFYPKKGTNYLPSKHTPVQLWFLNFFSFKLIFLVFLYYFDVLILKIKKYFKKQLLSYFQDKTIIKIHSSCPCLLKYKSSKYLVADAPALAGLLSINLQSFMHEWSF